MSVYEIKQVTAKLAELDRKGLRNGQEVTVGKAHSVWNVCADFAGDDEVWLSRQTRGAKVTSKRAKLTDINILPEDAEQVFDGRGWVLAATVTTTKLVQEA